MVWEDGGRKAPSYPIVDSASISADEDSLTIRFSGVAPA